MSEPFASQSPTAVRREKTVSGRDTGRAPVVGRPRARDCGEHEMDAHCTWLSPPAAQLCISGDVVHVWRASLRPPASCVQDMRQILTADEMERARRFRSARDRERFITGRGVLRIILSRYVHVHPADLAFCYTAYGKPVLAPELGEDIHFNLSHSEDLALCAMARGRQVGIDVERIRPVLEADQIAQDYFTAREAAALRDLCGDDKAEAFLRSWVLREAYAKALGDGLSLAVEQQSDSLVREQSSRLRHVAHGPREFSGWSLAQLRPAPGYLAAIAVEGRGWRLSCWHWGPMPVQCEARETETLHNRPGRQPVGIC